ncbi:hypothetical protein NDR87_31910 [Nocardia sp. CDC159]|uniref:Poly(3-hydroxybutyrate) depolymerase n=1 Tax=Nocardia pulmonis TaxID=2951408 RepID=A0A9X2ECA8_9NOCA|nr:MULTISPECIES: PHB depolymerase family esterase [Nocardia]MCM6778097.1 hypothetical protein [Nocardia pulmonis]MCM6790986.1 hypothetical protein [Nocardia sp. CDC159]
MKRLLLATAVIGSILMAGAAFAAVPQPVSGSLTGFDIKAVYVSGVSSGGYLANQLHVAHSGTVKGAAIFTAGPYNCAQGSVSTAQFACMQTYQPRRTPARLVQETRDRAARGTVDPVAGLRDSKVYLYHGTSDNTVVAAVNDDLAAYYREFGAKVVYDNATAAGHGWVSPLGSVACSSTASPFINNCRNDPERDLLAHLLGGVQPAAGSTGGKLIRFDQNVYAGGAAASIGMDANGFVYVPSGCAAGRACTLLVALHGCKQGYGYNGFGETFMRDAYLNEYADTNDIVVLYPQAIPAPSLGNPNGCWDWWGYTGTSYAEHAGPQVKAIMGMVRALSSDKPPTTTTAPPTTTTVTPTTTTTTTPPTPVCVKASNYDHTVAGRAYHSGGYTFANGSNDAMGLWNTFVVHSLKRTGENHWVLADGQC